MPTEPGGKMTSTIAEGLQPFYSMEVNALARRLEAAGRDICFLEQGQPSAPAAPAVIEAARRAVDQPQPYSPFGGLPQFRERLARHYHEQYGVTVEPRSVLATMGSSGAFVIAFLCAFPHGAKIAVTRPGYPAYLNTLIGMGFHPVEIEVHQADGWHLTAAAIEAAHAREPFAGLLLASPANPTGAGRSREQLGEIIDACRRLRVRFISDEIYHGLDYAGPSGSALQHGPDSIVVNSFSKYYCMTGWRIGWIVLPDDLLRRAELLQMNLFIAAPTISQVAATVALSERAYYDGLKRGYVDNQRVLVAGLRQIGFGVEEGDGAFYAYADASRFTNDSLGFCKELLDRAGVAVTPGIDFDRVNGQRFVRFSYAGSLHTMETALERIASFVKGH